jgi:hypothetical protein
MLALFISQVVDASIGSATLGDTVCFWQWSVLTKWVVEGPLFLIDVAEQGQYAIKLPKAKSRGLTKKLQALKDAA